MRAARNPTSWIMLSSDGGSFGFGSESESGMFLHLHELPDEIGFQLGFEHTRGLLFVVEHA
jgi:hypothetical protein